MKFAHMNKARNYKYIIKEHAKFLSTLDPFKDKDELRAHFSGLTFRKKSGGNHVYDD